MFVLLFLTKSTLPSSGSTEVRKHLHSPTVAFEACYASITLTTSSFQSNLQIDSVNRRRYGRSSQSSLKIPSSNLEQSLHLASPPSATLTFPPLLTALSLLFLTPPTPTPILTLQTTFTTPTLLHQPQTLSPLSHPSYPPNNYAWKIKKTPASTTSAASTTTTSTTSSINTSAPTTFPKKPCSKRTKLSDKIIIPKRHPPTLSPFISTDFRLKLHKKYPLPFAHHRTSPTPHHQFHSFHYLHTTKTPVNTKISTTPAQSTSTAPIQITPSTSTIHIHNTLTTITNTTTPTTTINTTSPSLPWITGGLSYQASSSDPRKSPSLSDSK